MGLAPEARGGDPWERFLALELGRLNGANVRATVPPADLLGKPAAAIPTRDGGVHRFDAATVSRLAAALLPLTRARLRVPLVFYLDREVLGDAYLADAVAIDAVGELGELGLSGRPRDGNLWVSAPRARAFAKPGPTLVQFVSL